MKSQDTQQWRPMGQEAQFILFCVLNSFLICDYEYCLRITQTDFSFVANSALFEGNLLRFRSIASLKLFEFAVDEDETFVENFDLIIQAIESAQNALDIYKAEDEEMMELEPNHYGIALAQYNLGYIYDHFGEHMADSRVKHLTRYGAFVQSDYQANCAKASEHYRLAAESFQIVQHKMGDYLSRKHQLETLSKSQSGIGGKLIKHSTTMLWNKVDSLCSAVQEYFRQAGCESTCWIPRESGDDVSLLTEIVASLQKTPLFPSKGP